MDPALVARVERQAGGLAAPEAIEAELEELADATDAGLGGTAVPPAPVGEVVVPRFTAERFASPALGARHFGAHGAEFGLPTEVAYTAAAAAFLVRAQEQNTPALVDADGIVWVYDAASNTLAGYDPASGTIKTFLKPTSTTYWQRRAPDWGDPVTWG